MSLPRNVANFGFKVSPLTSEAARQEKRKTNKTRAEQSLCVFKMALRFLKISRSLRKKNRFWYVMAWLFFNTFFTHDCTAWKKKKNTPMEQVLEVKNKSFREMGISQVNGVCTLWYFLQTGIFHYSDASVWDRKTHIRRKCCNAAGYINQFFVCFFVFLRKLHQRICQNFIEANSVLNIYRPLTAFTCVQVSTK